MTNEESNKILDEVAAKLGEHYDAVQILATWTEEGVSRMTRMGRGNFYARMGMAHRFIEREKAEDQAIEIAEKMQPPTDEGDSWQAT